MELKIKKLKTKIRVILKEYYLVILASVILILFLIIGINLIISLQQKNEKEFKEKFVIISFNKILYIDKTVKDPQLNEAIQSYETGYIEKAKFLFNAVLEKTKDEKIRKIALVNLANIFDDNGEYELALKYLKKSLNISPRDWIIYHNLGIVYKHLKEYENAIKAFKKAIKYNKNFLKSYLSLASIYFYLKDYRNAFEYYNKARKLNPALYEASYNAAVCLFKLKKREDAIKILEDMIKSEFVTPKIRAESSKILGTYFASKANHQKALFYFKKAAQFYEDSDLYYRIGVLYVITGDYQKALDNFKKSYLLNQNDVETIKHLAELYYRFGDFDNSLKYYKYLLETAKSRAEILLSIGEIYYRKQEYPEALKYYKEALNSSLTPDMTKIVYVNLGNLYSALEDYENAIDNYNKALEFDKLDVNIYYNIGILNLKQNNYFSALENFKKAVQVTPSNIELNLLVARTYLLMNQRNNAIITYSRIIEQFPHEVMPYFELATLYYKLSKYKDAQYYYNKILALEPPQDILYKVYLNLGVIADTLKEYDNALQLLKKAYSLKPVDPYVNYNIGIVYQHTGNIEKAKEYFKRTLRLKSDNTIRASTHLALGNCYYMENDKKRAKQEYEFALKYNPNLIEAHYNLKVIEGKM